MPQTIVKQCKSCPWKIETDPDRDIPNYRRDLACDLRKTIASRSQAGLDQLFAGKIHVMACHYSKPGAEFACAGWLHNQLGVGNNIAVRLRVMTGQLPVPEIEGEQHDQYEDTLKR